MITLENVQVQNKREDKWRPSANSAGVMAYWGLFLLEDGTTLELKMTKYEDFERLKIAARGTLTYQKKRIFLLFVKFEARIV